MHHRGYKHLMMTSKQARSIKLCLSCALQFVGTMYEIGFDREFANFHNFIYLKHSAPIEVPKQLILRVFLYDSLIHIEPRLLFHG